MEKRIAERHLVEWLEKEGYEVNRTGSRTGLADLVASRQKEPLWLMQVLGDQSNERLTQNAWFIGIGQITCAMIDPTARYSLAVTPQYVGLVHAFWPSLQPSFARTFSILVVRQGYVEEVTDEERPAAPPRPPDSSRGQGHPDGQFMLKGYRYQVLDGKLVGVRHPYGEPLPIRTFASFARALRIKVGSDSATRVINRARKK